MKTTNKQQANYTKPQVKKIELDKRISITMTSPPGDPPTPMIKTGSDNPFK